MRYIAIILLFACGDIFADKIPSIFVANILYSQHTDVSSHYISDDTDKVSKENAQLIQKQVIKNLSVFTADTKGSIVLSKQFKVVNVAQINALWDGNTQKIIEYIEKKTNKSNLLNNESSSIINQLESNPSESKVIINNYNKDTTELPDYILLGEIVSITSDNDIENLLDTDKATSQYNIDISADYQLINTTDNSVIASFNAYGHANDVKIISNEQLVDNNKFHNLPLLINQASKDLAENVLLQIQQQLSMPRQDNKIESISNIKVYK